MLLDYFKLSLLYAVSGNLRNSSVISTDTTVLKLQSVIIYTMFRISLLVSLIATVAAFAPAGRAITKSSIKMASFDKVRCSSISAQYLRNLIPFFNNSMFTNSDTTFDNTDCRKLVSRHPLVSGILLVS